MFEDSFATEGSDMVSGQSLRSFTASESLQTSSSWQIGDSQETVTLGAENAIEGIEDAVETILRGLLAQVLPSFDLQTGQCRQRRLSIDPFDSKGTARFCRALTIMDTVHECKVEGGSITQRDLYYLLKSEQFPTAATVNSSCRDLCSILNTYRSDLNITTASGKGRVAGCCHVFLPSSGRWMDCRSTTFAVPGDITTVLSLRFAVEATFVLIVEKESVFRALLDADLCQLLPVVLVTAQGMPDVATRVLLRQMCDSVKEPVQLLALVDYNPAGIHIMLNYMLGCKERRAAAADEASNYRLPELQWLGVHAYMLEEECDPADHQELTDMDVRKLDALVGGGDERVPDAWLDEIQNMRDMGWKAEIEAAYRLRGMQQFCNMLAEAMQTHMAI